VHILQEFSPFKVSTLVILQSYIPVRRCTNFVDPNIQKLLKELAVNVGHAAVPVHRFKTFVFYRLLQLS